MDGPKGGREEKQGFQNLIKQQGSNGSPNLFCLKFYIKKGIKTSVFFKTKNQWIVELRKI